MRLKNSFVLLVVVLVFSSCAAPRWETELRLRVLEERVRMLDAKVDSLTRGK